MSMARNTRNLGWSSMSHSWEVLAASIICLCMFEQVYIVLLPTLKFDTFEGFDFSQFEFQSASQPKYSAFL